MVNHPNRKRVRKVAVAATAADGDLVHTHDHDYDGLLNAVKASFAAVGTQPLFVTAVDDLNETYLNALPFELRQVHNCHACRRFFERYGSLVTVADDGNLIPAMWRPEQVPEPYGDAFYALSFKVRGSKIVSPFYSHDSVWGVPVTGEWSHLSVIPVPSTLHRDKLLTSGQKMAAARESFENVHAALRADPVFKPIVLEEALRVLKAGALTRSEKFIGPVEWLLEQAGRKISRSNKNLLWRAVVTAPEGYLHPRTSVIGSLLEDIAGGHRFEDVQRRFNTKVAPLAYQRPQAAPTIGNIEAAENAIAKLGLTPALERRFARLEDVIDQAIWAPRFLKKPASQGQVFAHLRTFAKRTQTGVPKMDLPSTTMTWVKFRSTELDKARQLELLVPSSGKFIALVTAVHEDAPDLFKWAGPVSWYVYPGGSGATQWGLAPHRWCPLTAIVPLPSQERLHEGVVLTLLDCADVRNISLALFPELLKNELYPYRATIEAHSRSGRLAGQGEATACGYDVRRNSGAINVKIRIDGDRVVTLDRWD